MFLGFAVAEASQLALHGGWILALTLAMLALLAGWGLVLWRTTRFG